MGGINGDGYVYVARVYNHAAESTFIKIGKSFNPNTRIYRVRHQVRDIDFPLRMPVGEVQHYGMDVLRIIDCVNHRRVEAYLHRRYAAYRAEVPRRGGKSFFYPKETFNLTREQITELLDIDFTDEAHTCQEYEDDTEPASVGISGEVYRLLDDYVARQNAGKYPESERISRLQITDAALRYFLASEHAE